MALNSSSATMYKDMATPKKPRIAAALPQLPDDIIHAKILTQLPTKSLGQFRSVCKPWRSLLSSASFIKDHLKCTSQNPNDDNLVISKLVQATSNRNSLEIDVLSLPDLSETKLFDVRYEFFHAQLVGSINGIVCLYLNFEDRDQFILWNPAIKQAKEIASPFPGCSIVLCGFFWDEVENNFNIVACNYKFCEVLGFGLGPSYIYSCNSNSWSLVCDDVQFSIKHVESHSAVPSAIVNAEPYWQYFQQYLKKPLVMKFDARSKEFVFLPIPDVVSGQHGFVIVNWKERLCALVSKAFPWITSVDVYCFDAGCGVWSKMHNVKHLICSANRVVGCFKYGGEPVIDMRGRLMCYDHKTRGTESLGKSKGRVLTCFTHNPSLVFLPGMKPVRNEAPYLINHS